MIKLLPPSEPPKPSGERPEAIRVARTAGVRSAVTPTATFQPLTTQLPSRLRSESRELTFNTVAESGTGIRIGGQGGPEFPWQNIVDRLNQVLHSNHCVHGARYDYQVRAQIDAKQQVTLTRTSSTGDPTTDKCTDEELRSVAMTTDTTNPEGLPYRPRVVSIDVRRFRCEARNVQPGAC
jgi:hypothetical protein